MLDPTKILAFLGEKKLVIGGLAVAAAAPSIVMATPQVYEAVTTLPPQTKLAIAGITGVLAVGALAATSRWSGRAVGRTYRLLEKAAQRRREAEAVRERERERVRAFAHGPPGAELVVMLEKSAGNISNISLEPSDLPLVLQEELAAARRTVVVIGDTSPGVELDAPPELLVNGPGQRTAVFRKSPVRDDIGDAVRRVQQWLPRQQPALQAFLNRCELQVGVHISAPGCSALTDSLHGFGTMTRASERNLQVYVHDPREEADPSQADSPELANGHREHAEIPALVLASGVSDDPDLVPVMGYHAGRISVRRELVVDHRDVQQQILDLEAEFYDQAGRHGDIVIPISNFNGVKQNRMIRSTIDIIESACLRSFHPLGDPAQPNGPDYADVSHIPSGAWVPSTPFSFGDSNAALVAAKEIATGRWQSQFYGFAPDQVSLEQRQLAVAFVTGNPRAGNTFIESLERSLPVPTVVIAHWTTDAPAAYAVLLVPATPIELRFAGLKFDSQAFSNRTG